MEAVSAKWDESWVARRRFKDSSIKKAFENRCPEESCSDSDAIAVTMDVCDRNVPGIAEAMRAHSLKITPNAMLSRAVCMQRGSTLVINLPGSTKAATENWEGIVGVLPHAVKMTAGGGH